MSGPGLGPPGLGLVLLLVDRELILAMPDPTDSSSHYGPMGHTVGLPLVNTLDVYMVESETSRRRVQTLTI